MKNDNFTFEQNWDNDGMLEWHNAATLSEYHRLNEERNNCDLKKFDMFCAFSDEQFAQNSKTIRPLREGEKYVNFGAGVFGTRDGIERYLAYSEDIDRQIRERCDPQEIYCYEFNNYESCIAYDGDLNAIRLIIGLFGSETAATIKRFSAFYSLESLMKGGAE